MSRGLEGQRRSLREPLETGLEDPADVVVSLQGSQLVLRSWKPRGGQHNSACWSFTRGMGLGDRILSVGEGRALVGNSGEVVTDFPDHWHPLKTPISPNVPHACVPTVCSERQKSAKSQLRLTALSRSSVSQAGFAPKGDNGTKWQTDPRLSGLLKGQPSRFGRARRPRSLAM